jgi:hypothetical protein
LVVGGWYLVVVGALNGRLTDSTLHATVQFDNKSAESFLNRQKKKKGALVSRESLL